MKIIQTLLLVVGVLLLPSCVFSMIGKSIREAGSYHTVLRPVGTKMYQTAEQRRKGGAYIPADEYQYYDKVPLIQIVDVNYSWPKTECSPEQATGVRRVVRVSAEYSYPWSIEQSIPKDARPFPMAKSIDKRLSDYGNATEPSVWRVMAAAPFDYLIDPVLTVVMSSVYTPFCIIIDEIQHWGDGNVPVESERSESTEED